MTIWRLVAHHEYPERAVEEMKKRDRIAIGWSEVGDLSKAKLFGPSDIAELISNAYDGIENAHLGGPSLWNLYHFVRERDFVIVNAHGRRECVFEVTGPYVFESGQRQIMDYAHQRPACLTSIDPEDLWSGSGSAVAKGQNIRWTLAACPESPKAQAAAYREGARFSVVSTAIERNPLARKKCIEHFGCKCFVCGFDFERTYGALGAGYIHVHHKTELSTKATEYVVDPVADLIPLCPNCHAMVHQRRPPVPVEEMKMRYRQAMSNNVLNGDARRRARRR